MIGEPVYNSAQRRLALAKFKRYIDLRRKRNNLSRKRAAPKGRRRRKKHNLPRNINLIRPYKQRAALKGRKRRKRRRINQRGRR